MSVVKINAIEVIDERKEEFEQRFLDRAGEVEMAPGFEGFELLRPVEGDDRYFVYTRWESEDAFKNWVKSDAFRRGHTEARRNSNSGVVAHGSKLLGFEVIQKVETPVTTGTN